MSSLSTQENVDLESTKLDQSSIPNQASETADILDNAPTKWAFVKKYERDHQIGTTLNQIYYWSDKWGFRGWLNNFYDEWEVIFANQTWDAKVFKLAWEQMMPISGKYYQIEKHGNFYVWTRVDESKQWNMEAIEASKRYVLLNKEWREIKNLRWHLFLQNWVYTETYVENGTRLHAFYDEEMNLLADKIPENTQLLAHKDGSCLFRFDSKIFLTQKWKLWDGKYPSEELIEQEDVFKEYQRKEQQSAEDYARKNQENESFNLDYAIDTDDNWYVQKITDKEWTVIFNADDRYLYRMNYPYFVNGKTPKALYEKKDLNKWLFVLQKLTRWDRDVKLVESILLNWNNGETITSQPNSGGWFIVHWNVVSHYLDWDTAQLYTSKGEKLGIEAIHFMNNHDFKIFTNENNKQQLVEQKTWIVHKQEFDKYLKTYKEDDSVVVIVENEGQIKEIALYK